MDFRTEVFPENQSSKISYSTGVMFIGSCFSAAMASKLSEGLIPVLCNPYGTVYNPASIASTIRSIIEERNYTLADLWHYNGKWMSFSHYTEFSSNDRDVCLSGLNNSRINATKFLRNARFLFVTFGTARVYRRIDTGEIVANCHKIPGDFFSSSLLEPDEIVSDWENLFGQIAKFNTSLRVIFTVSPVRHWKDGPFGNQVSKSSLFLAVDRLLKHPSSPGYFTSYEMLIDDLRDYRFYAPDMLHPSEVAVNYIWEKFSAAYFDKPTEDLWRKIAAVSKAASHRITSASKDEIIEFAGSMLGRIERIEASHRDIDLSSLRRYFTDLMKKHT